MCRYLMKRAGLLLRLWSRDDGQVVVIAVGLIIASIGFAAIVIDFGQWMGDRRDEQGDVDAVVLAAGRELPDASAGSDIADAWAEYNGVFSAPNGNLTPWDSDGSPCAGGTNVGSVTFKDRNGIDEDLLDLQPGYDTVCAIVERDSPALFSKVLGGDNARVRAAAAAGLFWLTGSCIQPWAVTGMEKIPGFGLSEITMVTFHYGDPQSLPPGQFGALRVYGNGTQNYIDAISQPCGGDDACGTGDPAVHVGEEIPCNTEPGNMGANTRSALEDRCDNSAAFGSPGCTTPDTACDVPYKDSRGLPIPVGAPDIPGTQLYMLHQRLQQTSPYKCNYRMIIIPILEDWPQGNSAPAELLGLGTFYYTGYDRQGSPTNGDDANFDGTDDVVWGFFLKNQFSCVPAMNCEWGSDPTDFAPINVLLMR